MLVRGCLTNATINPPVPYRILIFQDRAYNGGVVRPIEQVLEIELHLLLVIITHIQQVIMTIM